MVFAHMITTFTFSFLTPNTSSMTFIKSVSNYFAYVTYGYTFEESLAILLYTTNLIPVSTTNKYSTNNLKNKT